MNPNSNKTQNKPALGKGLASLLPNAGSNPTIRQILGDIPPPAAPETTSTPNSAFSAQKQQSTPPVPPAEALQAKERISGITMMEIDEIVPNQFQPRRDFAEASLAELAESIKSNGVIQPLVIRRTDDGKYSLIAGERRLRASKLAGLKQVPVVIKKTSDKEALEMALIENIQREDLNCVDVALSYFQLSEDFKLSQEEISKRVGKDRTTITNHLRILKLPETIIEDLRSARLTFGHGKALLTVQDPLRRVELRNKIIEKSLSVRETERIAAGTLLAPSQAKQKDKKPEDFKESEELKGFSERLGRALGTKAKIQGDRFRGTIVIEYFSREDLDRIGDQILR